MPKFKVQEPPPNWRERTATLITWYSGVARLTTRDGSGSAPNVSRSDLKRRKASARKIVKSMKALPPPTGTSRHMAAQMIQWLGNSGVELAFGMLHSLFQYPTLLRAKGETAKQEQARAQIKNIERALHRFAHDNGFYPSTGQGLHALVWCPENGRAPENWQKGGYLDFLPDDPWGNPYIYHSVGKHSYVVDWEAPEFHLGVQALMQGYYVTLNSEAAAVDSEGTERRRGRPRDRQDDHLIGSFDALFWRGTGDHCSPVIALFRNAILPDKPPLDGRGIRERLKKMTAAGITGKHREQNRPPNARGDRRGR